MKTQEKNKSSKSKNPFKETWNGVPATVRKSLFEASLFESFFASIFCHIAGLLFIWLISFALLFFGITPKLFPMPKTKVKDIEFNLTGKQRHRIRPIQKAIPSTKDFNSVFNPQTKPVASQINNKKSKSVFKGNQRHSQKAKSKNTSQHSGFVIPDFSMDTMSNLKSMSSGLGGSSGRGKHHAGTDSSISSFGDFDNSSSEGRGSSGHSGFDKNATKKIITTYDISPYVNELKRNIRWNWKAPENSKRVELFLRIAKDGRLIILNVKRTSEIGEVDNAALNAVRKCVPLNPLPAKYNKNYLDVIFTFSSNSVGSRF